MNQHQPPRRATYQDVLDAPPNMVAELAAGQLHLHPRPRMLHFRVNAGLVAKIGNPFDFDLSGPGGWWIGPEPELHLGDDVLVPDVAGWRRSRMPVFPDTAATSVAPDWVCGVLSPRTRRFDLTEKRDLYAVHGVGHLWIVDPDARTLQAFAWAEAGWVQIATLADDAEVCVAPFDAITWPLSALWPPLPAPPVSDAGG